MSGAQGQDRWVFGYGSLMWRPGFVHAERIDAILHGRRRAFCIYSTRHRGRPERPGLVLGLVTGGSVRGIAYRVGAADWTRAYDYLCDREQPGETYVEAEAQVRLADGRKVAALTFLSNTAHPQWAGEIEPDRQAEVIAGEGGVSGANIDYLRDLVLHLAACGARDAEMERLLALAEARVPRAARAA